MLNPELMPAKLNYKAGVVLFYDLLRSEHIADKDINSSKGKRTFGVSPPYNDLSPVFDDKFTVPHNQLKNIMAILRICGRAKRVKALAWVKREMLIKDHVLVEDSPIYRKVREEFQINEKEVNEVMVKISLTTPNQNQPFN